MDQITTAIVAGLGKLAEPAIKDAYNGLKTLIINRFGEKSNVVEAVEKLEQKPDSTGRRETLKEELSDANANHDEGIAKAAEILLQLLEKQPGGHDQNLQQTVHGDKNVFSGTGNVTITRT